jgi:hypothetical protein
MYWGIAPPWVGFAAARFLRLIFYDGARGTISTAPSFGRERLAFVGDPEGNVVTLAAAAG